jgi:gliding motility-associated-like protein
VTTSGGCSSQSLSGTITVTPAATLALISAPATTSQTVCINTSITTINYIVGGSASGAAITSGALPAGVNGTYTGGGFTITGTPTVSGSFSYTVTTSGACSPQSLSGTITVTPAATLTLSSAPATTSQTVCSNTAIASITYANGGSATGASITTGTLPAGVNGTYAGGVYTITGTPTASGVFNYTVTTSGGCSSQSLSGTITVNAPVTPTFAALPPICSGTTAPTLSTSSTDAPPITGTWSPSTVSNVNTGVYTFTPTSGQCALSTTLSQTVNPTPVLVIQNPDAVCSPNTEDITNPSVAINNSILPPNTALNYYTDAAATIPEATPEAIPDSGTYYIKATVSPSGCNTTQPVSVTIYPQPAPLTPTGLNYCQGEGNIPALTADVDPGNTLVWYTTASGGGTGTTAPQYPSTANSGITPYFVTQKNANGCESAPRGELDVRVTSLPQVSVNASATEIYAESPAITVNLNGSTTGGSAVTVAWYQGEVQVGASDTITVTPPSSVDPPLDSTRYYFVATSTENTQCVATASVLINVVQHLLIPNIFSPNGDGINDFWDIKNIQEFSNVEVSIFNRYGQFIWESHGYAVPWDGNYNGQPLPVGTYFYIIKTTPDAKPIAGPISIVR